MVKKSVTCISLLFIGYGISYLYLDYRNKVIDLNNNELLLGKYFEREEETNTNIITTEINNDAAVTKEEYISILEIPRINFKRGLYDKESKDSIVDKNIIFLDKSDMPNQVNSRVIIVGHSGDTSNSYFKYLYKLKHNDKLYLYYNNVKYIYKVNDIYEIKKNGTLAVESNTDKKTLTLVTCKGSSKQLVIVSILQKEEKL